MNLFNLFSQIEKVDEDAVDKLAYYSRRQLLDGAASRLARMTTGAAVVAFGSVMNQAFAQSGTAVSDVLNFALTLEYLEDDYYKKGLAAANLIPTTDRAIFTQISKHETAHVALLKGALGTSAVAQPTFKYAATTFTDYQTFLLLAQAFEDTGVRAYKGQAGILAKMDVLTTALRIHSVEARHASEVRRLRSLKGWISGSTESPAAVYAGETTMTQGGVDLRSILPATISDLAIQEAFDEPLDKASVLAIATPYLSA